MITVNSTMEVTCHAEGTAHPPPLTRREVEAWPELGPMNLDKRRVLALIDRAEQAEAQVQVALKRLSDMESL